MSAQKEESLGGEEGLRTGVVQCPGSRGETGLAISTAALSMCILGWIILGATKALEDDLHLLLFQQPI